MFCRREALGFYAHGSTQNIDPIAHNEWNGNGFRRNPPTTQNQSYNGISIHKHLSLSHYHDDDPDQKPAPKFIDKA